MLNTKEIRARFEKCSGFVGTVKELSYVSGVPNKTIYKNKDLLESLGISLVAAKRGRKERSYVDNTFNEFDLTDFKLVLNGLYYSLGLYVPYSDKVAPFSSYSKLNISFTNKEYYVDYLRRVSKELKDLTTTDKYFVMEMIIQLGLPLTYLLAEDIQYYTEVTERLFSLTPTKEQLKVIDSIVRFALGKISPEHPAARIEAVAGASKSFCATIAKTVLEEKYGFDSIPILSISSAVADNNKDGKTIAKEFLNLFGVVGDFDNLVELKNLVKFKVLTGEFHKKQFAIIDEHSTLSDIHVDIFELYYHKSIFLGDTAQIRQNNSYMGPVIGTLSEQFRFINSKTDIQKTVTSLHITRQTERLDEYMASISSGTFNAQLGIHVEGGKAQICTKYAGSFDFIYNKHKNQVHSLSTQVIAYAKRAVEEFNRVANGGTLEIKKDSIVTITHYVHKAGDKGKTGGRFKVLSVNGSECTLFSPEKGTVIAPVSSVELSFAATSSKVQGRGFTTVIFLGGTSCSAQHYSDLYSGITRAAVEVYVYLREDVDESQAKLMNLLLPFIEGKRNDKLNKDLYVYFKEALKSGLGVNELLITIKSALSGVTTSKEYDITLSTASDLLTRAIEKKSPSQVDTVLPGTPKKLTKNYGFVLVTGYDEKGDELKWYPNGEDQRNKTKEEAQYLLDQHLKTGKYVTGYLTEELCGGNRIVIDCDNEKTVNLFLKYKDITESYYSKDSMHLVFTVEKFFKRSSFNQEDGFKGDLLGNATYSLRNIKDNKTPNYEEAVPLPVEVEQLLSQLTK